MNIYPVHQAANGKKYVEVYFMTFIELDNFLAGKDIYVKDEDSWIVSMEQVDKIPGDRFGSEK